MSKDKEKGKSTNKPKTIKKDNGKSTVVVPVKGIRAYTTGDEGEIVWGTN